MLVCGSIEDRGICQVTPKLLVVCPVRMRRKPLSPSRQRASTGLRLLWSVRAAGLPRRSVPLAGVPQRDLADSGVPARGRIKPEGPFAASRVKPEGRFASDYLPASTCAIRDTATGAADTARLPPGDVPVNGAASTVRAIARQSLWAPADDACRLLTQTTRREVSGSR